MNSDQISFLKSYKSKIDYCFDSSIIHNLFNLSDAMNTAWKNKSNIFICGNGGSAGNANHLANDFTYGVGINAEAGMRIESLSSNSSVLTCLANDIGYENIYSEQIRVKGNENDLLIILSGSGNSPNVVNALKMANKLKMKTYAILGFDGGKCKKIADETIHFEIDDMQISEDMQLIVGHLCMQWLCNNYQK